MPNATDPAMFANLTRNEVSVLADKLTSGASAAWKGNGDGAMYDFISPSIDDVQANYPHNKKKSNA